MKNKKFIKVICAFIFFSFLNSCSSDPEEPEYIPDEPKEDPIPDPDPEPDPGEEIIPEYDFAFYAGNMEINTEGGAKITSKENYIDCSISVSHINPGWRLDNIEAEIRGRGNSSWKWYDKKPYRIKFKKKQSVLGLEAAKSWVLLAEYRDPTDLMNCFVFELGQMAGMPFTNHNRYLEVTLNGEYIGLYHLTEQIQQNKARVDIDEEKGFLIELDADDGPQLAPDATDNFWSSIYYMPVCIKNPENLDNNSINTVKSDLALLEKAIYNFDWDTIQELLNVKSMADFLIVQELVYNVELDAPRSMYMYKNPDTKWSMGPLWDFDGGFDFDWGSMYTGHTFFSNYKELILGTKPFNHAGTQYRIPGFFSDLFNIPEFVEIFRERWTEISALVPSAWNTTLTYYNANKDSYKRESERWKIDKKYDVEIDRMHSWLLNRVEYLNKIIANY